MAGLGKSSNENSIYLGIAGGKIWQKKDADGNKITESHPDYKTQEYEFSGETKVRSGAQYDDFMGMVTRVEVKNGNFGEQLLVSMVDDEGTKYTFSLGTNNRNSQNFFSALLVMDLNEPLYLKPYDFEGKDQQTGKKTGKRVIGINFKQGGQKLDLKAVEGVPQAGDELYKSGNSKKIKRFFEDLNDWYVEQVNAKVVPALVAATPSAQPKAQEAPEQEVEEKVDDAKVMEEAKTSMPSKDEAPKAAKITPIKMKKAIKEYIAENYGDEYSMPKGLKGDELVNWYNLVQAGEELPFPEETEEEASPVAGAEVPSADLKSQLGSLLGK